MKIKNYFGKKVDVVLSDMAVNTTGNKNVDAIQTGELCKEAMNFSKEILKNEGKFVSKIFMGSTFNEVVSTAKNVFKKVSILNQSPAEKIPKKILLFVKIYVRDF